MEQTSNDIGMDSYTLHVTNLPAELEKDGVTSIFREYGSVTGVILIKGKNNTNQAYISYSKYTEAEQSINELNNKPPLMLYIQFKDKNLNKNRININVNLSNPIADFRYKDSALDCVQTTRQAIDMGRANCSPSFRSRPYTSDDELLYSVPSNSMIYNPYEFASPYHDTNLMYTSGTLQISNDGRRRVSFGRGYTNYNLPEPHYNVASYIQKVCEKREKGLYEFVANEDIENNAGNCKVCFEPTAYRCQKCHITFYCGKICQVDDWPKHKFDCQPIPPLVKVHTNIPPPRQNCSEIKISEEPEELKHRTLLRRPKLQIPSNEIAKETLSNTILLENQIQSQTTNIHEKINSKSSFQSEFEKFKDPSTILLNDNGKEFIPKDKFVMVIITTLLNEDECLVQRVDFSKEIVELFIKLNDYVASQTLVEPQENVLCLVKHENYWYRVTIISYRKDSESHVYYHDFGTYGDVIVHKVCPISFFQDIPCLARRIRFNKGAISKNIQEADMISVKAINTMKDGIIVVEVEPSSINMNNNIIEKMSECSINSNSSMVNNATESKNCDDIAMKNITQFPSVLKNLKVGETGLILFHAQLSQLECNITLVPNSLMDEFNSLLGEMKDDCLEQLTNNSKFSPKVGDLICGQTTEAKEWYRGIVLSTNPVIKLAVIDESRVFVPVQCTPISSKFSRICSLGLISQFPMNAKMPDTKLEYGDFKVVEISEKSKPLIQINIDSVCIQNVLLKKWIPKLEQKGIECAVLKSGDKVIIAYFSSQNLIYVLNQESEQKEATHRLEQNIAKYALNKIPLLETPVIGTMVMAHFKSDNNYYRAIVTKVKDTKILVKYIDYGNEEITTIDRLFVLPDDLKSHPTCVAKIKLRDVKSDVPLNQAATRYFQELISESAELICTFEGHPFEDGVTLKTLQNENVNLNMNNFITPTWEKDNKEDIEDKQIFYVENLPILPLGDVGEEVEAMVLSYFPETCDLILGLNDETIAKAIQDEMLQRIADYVEKTPDYYIPRDTELCIAKYKDIFYRAVCVDSSASPSQSRVFFIDYGNVACVDHTDIRMFTQDFASIGAYGTFCNLKLMVPKDKLNETVSQRIKELVPIYDIIKIKIISIDDTDKTPNIDIPAVREKLIEEKLI